MKHQADELVHVEMLFSSILYLFLLDFVYMFPDDVSEFCDKKQFLPFTQASNRSVNYDQTTSLSDRFMREGWYGALDFIIPSIQPASLHCGAKYPMFLQREPNVERTKVDVTVCVGDCRTRMTIKAVKCSERLTVYGLKRPPNSGAAYCLDGIKKVLPDFHTTVAISTNLQPVPGADSEQEYIFDCSFPDSNNDYLTYKATWFVNNAVVYESPYTDYNDTNNDRRLTDTRLRASNVTTVGFQLRCDINAAIYTQLRRRPSLPSTSPQIYIGMIVFPVISIQEGQNATIPIQSSVPIGCSEDAGCLLRVTTELEDGVTCGNNLDGCRVSLNTSKWDNWHRLQITSTNTEDSGETVTQKKVFLRTDKLYFNHPIWQNYTLDPVTINIAKSPIYSSDDICKIFLGPRVVNFDRRVFTVDRTGTFYLLKRDNFEVQVQIRRCSGQFMVYCACGAVVRVGRVAYIINYCNIEYLYTGYILDGDESNVLNVKKSRGLVEMFLRRGTEMAFYHYTSSQSHWLHINIHPFEGEIGQTSGLCGELRGDTETKTSNQYDDDYYNTWRVKNDVNLFDPDIWQTLLDEADVDTRFQYCRCEVVVDDKLTTTLNCKPTPGEVTCSSNTDYILQISKLNQSSACMQCVYCCVKHSIEANNETVNDNIPPNDNSTNFLIIGTSLSVAVVVVLIVVIAILVFCLVRNKKKPSSTGSNVDSQTTTVDHTYTGTSGHIYDDLTWPQQENPM